MPDDDLIGTSQASRILGIDKGTLTRWVKAGRIPVRARIRPATSPGANPVLIFERSVIEAIAESIHRAAS